MKAWIRRSFRNRIFVTILMITLVPLLLCDIIMMQVLLQRSESKLAGQAKEELARLEGDFANLMETFSDISEELCNNTMVHSALRRENKSSHVTYQLLFRLTDDVREYARFEIMDCDGNCQYTTDHTQSAGAMEPSWGILYAAGNSEELVFCREDSGDGMKAARAIRDYNRKILGYVVISMTRNGFDLLFSGNYSPTSSLLLLDAYWHPVYLTQSALGETAAASLRQQLLAGEKLSDEVRECSYFTRHQEATGFTLVLEQARTFTAPVRNTIYFVSIVMGILSLLLCLWGSWLLSRHLAEPVNRLDGAMKEVQKGNFDVCVSNSREDELGHLADSFNRMTEEYRKNLERTVEHQKEINATQLRMLQAQLNPHFLYNTLDSIKWLGVVHQVPDIATIATDLAALLRASISGNEFIPLSEELELIERYIAIQSIRFEDRFTCEIDIADRFQNCMVPKMVLQPLVENSILHGVADLEDGYIKLSAREEEGDLILSVSDNGCGIPPEILEQLNNSGRRLPGQHLGLFNVSSIIRLHFGEKYGISAEAEPGNGSVIRLRLPIQREETHA
ncbi:MAG: sensor histidine kinase [Lachnospiraceae bacterium]